jgi:hypothetical protein
LLITPITPSDSSFDPPTTKPLTPRPFLSSLRHDHSHPVVLYEFADSCWANVPKIALSETGYKSGDVEFKSINLAEVGLASFPVIHLEVLTKKGKEL